ncbi:MAG: amidohydrolase family protein, partial [Halanaerobium sp.]|nr:amidohydrolase family protein [Halanaerobium sp.]
NPQSNMGNGVGSAPIAEANQLDLPVGLGTDGFTADMFASLRTASLLLRNVNQNPAIGQTEAFQMAFTVNSAIAERYFSEPLGRLQPGGPADLIVVDYQPPTPITPENYFAHILNGFSGGMVEMTIIDGKILMEDGEVKVGDYERLQYEITRQAADFWRRF